jgi:hypothetical protein
MLETKTFEIRDKGTFIPVMATAMRPLSELNVDYNNQDAYLLRRAGYGMESLLVMLCKLDGNEITYTPESWRQKCWRTMVEAHKYIVMNWDKLTSGQVIDVEFILGETDTEKDSERFGA